MSLVARRMGTQGAVTVLPANSPWGMSTNPDGSIWFTDNATLEGTAAVVRMTLSGSVVASYPLGGDSLTDMTSGADGMLWFGDNGAIARLDPSVPPTS